MRIKTLFFTVAVMSMTAAVFAQDTKITPYASVRYFIGAYYQNKDFASTVSSKPDSRSDVDMVNSLINTSRLGVKFEKGAVSGEAQVRLGPGHNGLVQDALIYGVFKSSFGLEVMAGQNESPWTYSNANEAWDNAGDGLGSSKGRRIPQLKLSFAGAYIDLMRPPRADEGTNDGYQDNIYKGRDVYMPLTAVGYEFKSDIADIGLGFAGYKFIVKNGYTGTIKGNDSSANAWTYIGYLHGNIKLGAPYIKFNATYQKAPYMLNIPAVTHFSSGAHNPTSGLANDMVRRTDAFFEGFIELGFKTGLGTLSANFAYEKNLDVRKGRADRMAVGANFAIPVVAGFKVTPTVLYINELKNKAGVDQGYDLLAGLKLQYDL